jgi:hypothetical protein
MWIRQIPDRVVSLLVVAYPALPFDNNYVD